MTYVHSIACWPCECIAREFSFAQMYGVITSTIVGKCSNQELFGVKVVSAA